MDESDNYITNPFEIEEGPGVEFGPDSGSVFAIDPGALINLNDGDEGIVFPIPWLIEREKTASSSDYARGHG